MKWRVSWLDNINRIAKQKGSLSMKVSLFLCNISAVDTMDFVVPADEGRAALHEWLLDRSIA